MRVGAYRIQAHALLGTVFAWSFCLFPNFWIGETSISSGKEEEHWWGKWQRWWWRQHWWRQAEKVPGRQQKGRPISDSRSSTSDWDHEGKARITQVVVPTYYSFQQAIAGIWAGERLLKDQRNHNNIESRVRKRKQWCKNWPCKEYDGHHWIGWLN